MRSRSKVAVLEAVLDNLVLRRFRDALYDIYGDEVARIVLFGSRARDEGGAGSDYDIAVFLKELPDRWKVLRRLVDLRVELLDETGALIDAKPYPISAWRDQTPLMHEIRRDGLEL